MTHSRSQKIVMEGYARARNPLVHMVGMFVLQRFRLMEIWQASGMDGIFGSVTWVRVTSLTPQDSLSRKCLLAHSPL